MSTLQPKKIFIEKDVVNSPVTRQILNKLPDITVEYIDERKTMFGLNYLGYNFIYDHVDYQGEEEL